MIGNGSQENIGMAFSLKEIMVHYGRSLLSAIQASNKRETEIT